jgi:uncharacterized membrane protein YagU involved in acid resistance
MKQLTVSKAIFLGGTIAGVLDILFAISFAGYNGTAPTRLLQTVASGALGKAAFSGGWGAAALGLLLHFALSYLWATLFMAAAWRAPRLVQRPVLAGLLFGVVVFFCMRLIVLPLSAFPYPVTFKPLATALDLLSHMLLFGIPIAVATHRAVAGSSNNLFKP